MTHSKAPLDADAIDSRSSAPLLETRRDWLKQAGALAGVASLPLLGTSTLSFAQTKLNGLPRLALVIGNTRYRDAPLKNPVNDAKAIAGELQQSGFRVNLQLDAGRAQMNSAIQAFGDDLAKTKGIGLFYYAGHGTQLAWRNYLIPVDAVIEKLEDMRERTVDLSALLQGLLKASNPMNVIILDACRDNPFGNRVPTEAKGLSQFDAPPGSLLAYATAPGNTADDGDGANGLYTENLLRELKVPEAKIEDVFKRVRLAVRRRSEGRQIPWESTSLEDDFYFLPPKQLRKLSEEELEKQFELELSIWEKIKASKEIEPLEDYVRRFPSGKFSELAQFRLDRLLAAREQVRLAAEQQARQLEEERRARLAEEKRVAEEKRLAEERRAVEAKRLTDEKRLADERRLAEEKRLVEEKRLAEERRQADLKRRAEEQRIAKLADEQRRVEEARLAAEQKAADARRAAEEKRLADEKRIADERRLTDEKRLAEERRQAEEKRLAQEKQLAAERQQAEARRLAEQKRLADASQAAAVEPEKREPARTTPIITAQVAALGPNPFSKGTGKVDTNYRIGDRYTYRVVDLLTKIESRQFTRRITGLTDNEVLYGGGQLVRDYLGNNIRTPDGFEFTNQQFFVAEYSIGKKWSTRYRNVGDSGRENAFEFDFRVVALESITIPAGKFDAYKVEGFGYHLASGSRRRITYWIAPDKVRGVLVQEYEFRNRANNLGRTDREELVSFQQVV
jgi:uncharacterized caspase-like protein